MPSRRSARPRPWSARRAARATEECSRPSARHPRKLIYQVLPSRYGFNPHHLVGAQAVEIVVGQGAKPGTGGMLMGVKVLDHIAESRDLPSGIDQRSPARHPDWLGPDDLAVKIEQIREATDGRVPVSVKLGACRVSDDVKLAAKAGADIIVVDSMVAGTGASGEALLDHSGIPTVPAIVMAREALREMGLYGEVSLVASGGIRSGADMAKSLALGADAVAIGIGALIALNCNRDIPEADFEREVGVSGGRLPPLPDREVSRRDRHSGPRVGGAARPGRGGGARSQLPQLDDDGGGASDALARQERRSQPRAGGHGRPFPGGVGNGPHPLSRNEQGLRLGLGA